MTLTTYHQLIFYLPIGGFIFGFHLLSAPFPKRVSADFVDSLSRMLEDKETTDRIPYRA